MKKNEWMKRELTDDEKRTRGTWRWLQRSAWHGLGLGGLKRRMRFKKQNIPTPAEILASRALKS